MSFSSQHVYRGPVRAVRLDWAGTTMDSGGMAPAVVFAKLFERAGVPITMEEARAPMAPMARRSRPAWRAGKSRRQRAYARQVCV